MATPERMTDFLELWERRAGEHPERTLFRFLSITGEERVRLTFRETFERSRTIASWLQSERKAGEPVLLLFPPGPEFACAVLGCIMAGAIAVPVYPPGTTPSDQAWDRLRSVVRTTQPAAVLAGQSPASGNGAVGALPELSDAAWGDVARVSAADPAGWSRPTLGASSLAFLQFTSGSTASPKGVMVGHGNLMANLDQQVRALDLGDDMRAACWLPLYHDLGLISGIFLTIYCGGETTFISPGDFVRRPLLWLQAISRYGATLAGGPDFAYALCVRRSRPADREQLRLESWRSAFIGAEPVRAKTLSEFSSAFAASGFRPRTFCPGYGLAEATLLATMTPPDRLPVVTDFDLDQLGEGVAQPAAGPSATRASLVSCGPPVPEVDVRIVDPHRLEALPDDHVGEIWLRGPNVAAGYWRSSDTTTFGQRLDGEAGFLRTGDLGFLHHGELYITGRAKDLIIIRGRNHSPVDIEQTVEAAHPVVRPAACAAFSVEGVEGEELVVVAEAQHDPEDCPVPLAAVRAAVDDALAHRHGVTLRELVLIPPWTLPRTSSGKVQRHAARAAYLDGSLAPLAETQPVGGR